MALVEDPLLVQRTVTGQLPGVVREPTVQLQDTVPLSHGTRDLPALRLQVA